MPISISVGLFDENRKNIGMINYCSSYDLDSMSIKYKDRSIYHDKQEIK